MRVLVVGGAGYIGSHVCKEIARRGWKPIAYDNLSIGHEWAVKWGPLEIGDIRDTLRLKAVLTNYCPDAVVHLAAHAYVGESIKEPEKYYYNNVAGTLSLLSAMREMNVKNIVFSSSCATYGLPEKLPVTEEQHQNPINPYGRSKLFVEKILSDYAAAYSFKVVCLRYFNAAGADPDGEIGEIHDPETHIIPIAINVAAGKQRCVEVFGNDYDTDDGTCVRDYTHVSDLARAHVAAISHMSTNGFSFDAFNLGIGKGFSVLEIIKTVELVSSKKVSCIISGRRPGDPPILIADPSKANKFLKWTPQFSQIEEIVSHAWKFSLQQSSKSL